MRTALTERFGIDYPVFAFTPSKVVAAAVSRAGGLGVLGAVRYNDPGELDAALTWMDQNTDGRPYGVDVVMPNKVPTEGTPQDLAALVPAEHRAFVDRVLSDLGVPPLDPADADRNAGVLGWLHSVAHSHVEVALRHRPVLIANALGSPPPDVIEQAHAGGVQVAALAGAVEHALAHVDAGVDVVIAQGGEAGGHTGEVATLVLVPEIVRALGGRAPVLAAGGIGSGAQLAAVIGMGAEGAWMGSRWLTAREYSDDGGSKAMQRALVAASSRDTVRTRIYSGKPARLLRSAWTDAWQADGAPEPLQMPLQNLLVAEAHQRIAAVQDPQVVAMPAGQIIGSLDGVVPVTETMDEIVDEYHAAVARMRGTVERG
ncbi:NAD(P)H-dependent flavin oxidoreductase [Dietzia sp.]|uniref:NAD(P)H-dependent flavin oxidoreductase n=1 Tax=Dietzia sp. TaxID=1871616 RepID=UPI002FDB96B1